MNKELIVISVAAAFLLSCAKEVDKADSVQPMILPGETITFIAGWAGSEDTKTILQPDGTSVWWESGAQINVFFGDKASGKFISTNSQAQAVVDFQGTLPIMVGSLEAENPPSAYWAVYPYDEANICDGESVTLSVPTNQTAVAGSFANKMFPSIATSTNFHLAFYNICGGVRFSVANEGISTVMFKAKNGESISGKVQVGFDGVPVVESIIEGSDAVVVNAPSGGFVPGTYYFAAMLPQTLEEGLDLFFIRSDGKVATTCIDKTITVNRSRFGILDDKDEGLEFVDDSGHIPSGNIVFADFKVETMLVDAFDTDNDGQLSYAEAAAVTSADDLKVAFGSIQTYESFDEFQFFTGISSIPDNMFKNWAQLSSIVFPSSVTTIGANAFYGCTGLTSITIPGGVTSIGGSAFYGCRGLTSITIPGSVTSIGGSAFSGCTGLTCVTILDGVTSIGGSAFYGCTGLTSITIPESVTSIGSRTFYDCRRLTSITIPGGVTSIGESAFYNCTGLTSITIPGSVTSIGESAFRGCRGLTSITIPGSVTSIGGSAFYGCTGLTSITIPGSVTSIGGYAFSGCTSLFRVSITEGVTSIGGYAFSGCTGLSKVTIPDGVKIIGESAFRGCTGLTSIVIPGSVTSIGASTFYYCTSLTNVTILDGVKIIGESAFRGCTGLTSIVIPGSVTSIGAKAFENCIVLTNVTIPDGVTTIGAQAFQGCTSLTNYRGTGFPGLHEPDQHNDIRERYEYRRGCFLWLLKPDCDYL